MTTPRTTGWQVYRRLVGYALGHRHYLALAVVGLVISAATQSLFAWGLEPLLDKAILQRDPVTILWFPIGILLLFLVRGLAMFMSGYYIGLIGRAVTKTLRGEVFGHLLRMPVRFFEESQSGKLLSYVSHHIEQVSNASIRGITTLVQDSMIIIGMLAMMLWKSWQLTIGMLVIVPLIALIVMYATRRLRHLSHKVQDSVGDVTQIANEMIRGYKVVRIFNGEEYEAQRFNTANERNIELQMKRMVTELLSTPLVQFMVAVALAAMVFVATRVETLSPGMFMSFIMSMILLLTPIRNLTQLNAQLQTAIAAGEGIFELLDSPTEPDHGTKTLPQCRGAVTFRDVSFVYPDTDKQVLRHINVTVQAGEKIALVGKSGSGKTTLVNLLPRFHDVHIGEILLDDVPLQDIRLHDLRSHIAYVGQDIVLFNDTVRNNIAYGAMQNVADTQVHAAAQAAHALEFIEKLPHGFDTLIGDNGVMLSGGQRQRLSIARAILSNAPILILDEATSALDTESERHIQSALDNLLSNRTTFMIAHRLSTIENADRILVMQDGAIIESGKHSELLALQGQYARLHALQFHDET